MATEDTAGDLMSTSDLSLALGRMLEKRGLHVGTAESCTGGMIAGAITDVPGSSGWFDRGVVTYSNAAKQALLGVDELVFEQHGAVSEACVIAMATGALHRFGVDVAISISGIAGPGGESPGKPVGTVWIGWALRPTVLPGTNDGTGQHAHVEAAVFCFSGDRLQVREQAVRQALHGTISRIEQLGISK